MIKYEMKLSQFANWEYKWRVIISSDTSSYQTETWWFASRKEAKNFILLDRFSR
jgi:hypothetical protein